MNRCEDYPCCGHTNEDPCGPQWYDASDAFDTRVNPHALCDHENGDCDVADDNEPHEYDYDDLLDDTGRPWCWGCDAYAQCGEWEPDGAPREQWEVTTPPEVYMNEDSWLDGSYEE
jgi:hypothetical protein